MGRFITEESVQSDGLHRGASAESEDGQIGGGFSRINPLNPRYHADMAEAAGILKGALSGSFLGMHRFQEALSISDFPIFLNAVLDRELLARYEDQPAVWREYAREVQVRDFRPKTFVDLLGGRTGLERVKPGAEYPARDKAEAKYELSVGKFGGRFSLVWEDFVNDDLDVLRTLPDDLAAAAGDTVSMIAAGQLVRASGANTDFFKAANGNTPTALPLTRENLEAALIAITTRKDSQKRPIQVVTGGRRLRLVVPPELAIQAQKIVDATEVRVTAGQEQVTLPNNLRGVVKVVVDPWLSVIATDAKAATRWFVLPDPGAPRPAVAVGFLRGRQAPELRVKADTGTRVGGGNIDPTEGSFDHDGVEFRVRQVAGGATLDPIGTYVSNGS